MTSKSIRTVRRKIWWRDNLLMVIMSIMIGGYFTYDLVDKQQTREMLQDNLKSHSQYDRQLLTLCLIVYNTKDIDPLLKESIGEYIKIQTRGNEN